MDEETRKMIAEARAAKAAGTLVDTAPPAPAPMPQAPAAPKRKISPTESALYGAAPRWLGFGLDDVAAGLGAALGTADFNGVDDLLRGEPLVANRDDTLNAWVNGQDERNAYVEDAYQQNPNAYKLAAVPSALLSGVVLPTASLGRLGGGVGLLRPAVPFASRATAAGARLAGAAAAGGLSGALTNLGMNPTETDAPEGGVREMEDRFATGGAYGAMFGAAGPALGYGLRRGANAALGRPTEKAGDALRNWWRAGLPDAPPAPAPVVDPGAAGGSAGGRGASMGEKAARLGAKLTAVKVGGPVGGVVNHIGVTDRIMDRFFRKPVVAGDEVMPRGRAEEVQALADEVAKLTGKAPDAPMPSPPPMVAPRGTVRFLEPIDEVVPAAKSPVQLVSASLDDIDAQLLPKKMAADDLARAKELADDRAAFAKTRASKKGAPFTSGQPAAPERQINLRPRGEYPGAPIAPPTPDALRARLMELRRDNPSMTPKDVKVIDGKLVFARPAFAMTRAEKDAVMELANAGTPIYEIKAQLGLPGVHEDDVSTFAKSIINADRREAGTIVNPQIEAKSTVEKPRGKFFFEDIEAKQKQGDVKEAYGAKTGFYGTNYTEADDPAGVLLGLRDPHSQKAEAFAQLADKLGSGPTAQAKLAQYRDMTTLDILEELYSGGYMPKPNPERKTATQYMPVGVMTSKERTPAEIAAIAANPDLQGSFSGAPTGRDLRVPEDVDDILELLAQPPKPPRPRKAKK